MEIIFFYPNAKMLWSDINAYDYQTVYDIVVYDTDIQWPNIKLSLINFLFELNNVESDYPDEVFILSSIHLPPGDSQDSMDEDTQVNVGPSKLWYKQLACDIDSDNEDYHNFNLSPLQNSQQVTQPAGRFPVSVCLL
ncbi:hypothetical protein ACOSP7_022343 [Xanthoceras sorbifolium]